METFQEGGTLRTGRKAQYEFKTEKQWCKNDRAGKL
jgi:hypothetical protein